MNHIYSVCGFGRLRFRACSLFAAMNSGVGALTVHCGREV